ncbi:MAG: hypothetical protein HKN43_13010 [Rhodothermales bacterium]|nr:hypothetical protein [Rhodothermales bacterium]
MGTVYIISLIVGGFFVLLSLLGGDSDSDLDLDGDFDADFDLDADGGLDLDADGGDIGAGTGLVDLLSIRTLFLFAAFFGLTGVLLGLAGSSEPVRLALSLITGIIAGFGGNYLIKKVGYATVSSDVSQRDLKGLTGRVLLPFDGSQKGKVEVIARGQRMQLTARSITNDRNNTFEKGDEIVIVNLDGQIATVVKPD